MQLVEQAHHVRARSGIEVARRLVRQQQGRPAGQRPRNRHALLLAAGKLGRLVIHAVKQADALCAYLKCLEELSAGNNEVLLAKTRLAKTLESRRSEEMDYFMDVFVPSFHLSLDEISQDSPL